MYTWETISEAISKHGTTGPEITSPGQWRVHSNFPQHCDQVAGLQSNVLMVVHGQSHLPLWAASTCTMIIHSLLTWWFMVPVHIPALPGTNSMNIAQQSNHFSFEPLTNLALHLGTISYGVVIQGYHDSDVAILHVQLKLHTIYIYRSVVVTGYLSWETTFAST